MSCSFISHLGPYSTIFGPTPAVEVNMTESVVNFFGTRDWDWKVISALTLCVPFLLTYFITLWNSTAAIRYKNATLKRPPTYPYVIPWLGHLISYGLDADSFLKAAKYG